MNRIKNQNKVIVTQSHCREIETNLDILHLPIIEFEKLEYESSKLHVHYDWVVITSKNTVKFFKQELETLSYSHIASIGRTTTEALIDAGFKVDFEPSTYTQEGFMEEFRVEYNLKILYPASNEKRPLMRDFMVANGANVVEIDLYHPVVNRVSINCIREHITDVAAITFSSPSGVHAFMDSFRPSDLKDLCIVSIGHVTKSALGLYQVNSSSPPYATLESMIRLLEEELNNEI